MVLGVIGLFIPPAVPGVRGNSCVVHFSSTVMSDCGESFNSTATSASDAGFFTARIDHAARIMCIPNSALDRVSVLNLTNNVLMRDRTS